MIAFILHTKKRTKKQFNCLVSFLLTWPLLILQHCWENSLHPRAHATVHMCAHLDRQIVARWLLMKAWHLENVSLTRHRGSLCDQKCIKVGNKTWNGKLEKTPSFCLWSQKLFFGFFRGQSNLIVHQQSQVGAVFTAKCHCCLKAY